MLPSSCASPSQRQTPQDLYGGRAEGTVRATCAEKNLRYMTPSPTHDVDVFLIRHVRPAPGRTAEDAKDRILHWIEVANNPAAAIPTADSKIIADVRRKARQNVRRLVKKHPDIAAQINQAEVTR